MLDQHCALSAIKDCIKADLAAMDQLIQVELHSDVPLMQEIISYLIACGGKRIRPTLLLLSAATYGIASHDNEHHELACIIEFIHNATLLHDDVVDASTQRRGHDTANQRWGNAASVLAGDFLYSRAFQMLARRNNIPVMTILANTCNQLSEGELLQLACANEFQYSEAHYFKIIAAKTAALFSAACEIGALLAKPEDQCAHQNMQQFGYHLGMAFQIKDDVLDLTGDPETIGKNCGDDLAEHKLTLPVLYALSQLNETASQKLKQALINEPEQCLDKVIQACEATGAIEYASGIAQQHLDKAQKACQQAPNNGFRDKLMTLSNYMLKREH